MQAHDSAGYGSDLRTVQIALPLEAGSGFSLREASTPISERGWQREITPITPAKLREGDRVRVLNSHIKDDIGRQGTVGKPTNKVENRVRVLLDGDLLRRSFKPECLALLEEVTPITPDVVVDGVSSTNSGLYLPVGDRESKDKPVQLPTNAAKSVMGVEDRLAQLEAERSWIMAEGAVAQKGVWIEGFTTVRQRKSGKRVRYEYFHLCTWNSKEKCEQKRHLGSAKDSRYLQAREAIWRRDRLEAIDGAIERLKGR